MSVNTRAIVLVTTPKGGSGKTTAARLLVSEAVRDRPVFGIDLDPQRTFRKWFERRETARTIEPDLPRILVEAMSLKDWRRVERAIPREGFTVIDTPPSVEDHIAALDGLRGLAGLVVIPCSCTQDDVDSIGPWAQAMTQKGGRVVVVLNRADRRRRSYVAARNQLVGICPVCPVEIPYAEEMHVPFSHGLAPRDLGNRTAGQEASAALWGYVRRELGL